MKNERGQYIAGKADNQGNLIVTEEAVAEMMGDFFKNHVWLEVDEKTESSYIGGMDGSSNMYKENKHINIRLLADINGEEVEISRVEFEV